MAMYSESQSRGTRILATVVVTVFTLILAQSSATASTLPSMSYKPHVVTSCLSSGQEPYYDAYDPGNGYVYADDGGQQLFVVKAPCKLIKTVTVSDNGLSGLGYDPVTKEMVVANCGATPEVDIFQGTSVVKEVSLRNGSSFTCPTDVAWDGAIGSMLVSDSNGGVDLLYLAEVNGTTRAATIINAFDVGNSPGALLVAHGYIFESGNQVDVFNERTLSYVGSFPVAGGPPSLALAWDSLNDTVVLGRTGYAAPQSLFFLNADSIASHRFTFHSLPVHNILSGGVGGVAYSPFNHDIYFSAVGGEDVWVLNPSGVLSHVFLGFGGVSDLAYDSTNHDLYACAFDLYVVS